MKSLIYSLALGLLPLALAVGCDKKAEEPAAVAEEATTTEATATEGSEATATPAEETTEAKAEETTEAKAEEK